MNAIELSDALDDIGDKYLVILGDIQFKEAAAFVRSQEKYINQLHKLLNYNGIGAGKDLLTGEVIPFEVNE